jgi:hypothetical protein
MLGELWITLGIDVEHLAGIFFFGERRAVPIRKSPAGFHGYTHTGDIRNLPKCRAFFRFPPVTSPYCSGGG